MRKQWKLFLCLFIAFATMSACSGEPAATQQLYVEITQALEPTPAETPTPPPVQPVQNDEEDTFADGFSVSDDGYTEEDVWNEEEYAGTDYMDDGVYVEDDSYDYMAAVPEGTPYPYAGSTPIPLNPVDMPSATPFDVQFMMVPYEIQSIRVSFEGPAGWIPNESSAEVFTLTEPEQNIKGGQLGIARITASPVTGDYSEAALKSEVLGRLNEISATNFSEWKPSMTATRHLMGSMGVYAVYSGTMVTGVQIGGRVHYVCIDRVLYSIEIMYPLEYRDAYLEIFSSIRSSIKRMQ